jgi:hypothetical protein
MPIQDPAALQCWYAKTRNFVIAMNQKSTLNEAKSKAESKADQIVDEWE